MSAPQHPVRSVWVLPVVAIVLVAVAGQAFGVLGALLAAGSAAIVAVFPTAAAAGSPWPQRLLAAVVVSVVAALTVLFGVQGTLPWWPQTSARPSDSLDYRARPVTQADTGKLRGALLAGADLRNLDLSRTSLAGAVAPGVVLIEVRLVGANLRGADLRGASLQGADLTGACLAGANLAGAQLAGARVQDAQFDTPPAGTTGAPLGAGKQAPSCATS